MPSAYQLGASLYVPAIHTRLRGALDGSAYRQVRSLIACTEDAVAECDVDTALSAIAAVLPALPARGNGPLRFVRVRNLAVLRELLAMPGVERLHGVVIPKADADSLPAYLAALRGSGLLFMPTIETTAAFDDAAMRELRTLLLRESVRAGCLAIRIGGNDLLRLIGLRRPPDCTIYDTPIGTLIAQLVLTFKPHGFHLTAPVFDRLDARALLIEETRRDLRMGLTGKSAIHPRQVDVIESVLAVPDDDLAAAQALLADSAPAVFQHGGAMLEAAVHRDWAAHVLQRVAATATAHAASDLDVLHAQDGHALHAPHR